MSTLQDIIFDGDEIRGQVFYQDNFDEFSSLPEQKSGYYFAVNVTEWNGAKFRIDRKKGKGTEVAFNGDGIAILFLGKDEKDAKTAEKFVYIKDAEETPFTLNFTFVRER